MEEVKALDEEWDKTAEAMATAKALEGNQRAFNVQDLNDSVAAAAASGGEATAKMSFVQETAGSLENDQHSTDAYKMAWAKTMMGKTLTAKETEIMEKANAYTHTTENTGVVIPKTVADGIWAVSYTHLIDVGSEIYTLLRSAAEKHDMRIYIMGEACSAASIVACAAYCEMSPTALMMVHCVSSGARGNHSDICLLYTYGYFQAE